MTERIVNGPQGGLQLQIDRDGGAGLPVLLLHADAGRLEQWDELVAEVADVDVSLARLDFRGHGRSEGAADHDYSFAARGGDVLAVLDALRWERVLLVAHSGGNGAALAVADDRPDRVAGLLMVDPPTDPTLLPGEVRRQFLQGLAGPDSLAYLREYYRTIAGSDEAVVARVLEDARATRPDSRAGVGTALLGWSVDLLDRFEGPVHVIGTDVTDGPAAVWAERPDVPHEIVHGTGHWVAIERPDAVAASFRELRSSASN